MPKALVGAALLCAMPAYGAGYYQSAVGTRAYTRGGALIAGADNLLAMYHNPAALIRLDRPQFMLDVAGVQQWVEFNRTEVAGNGPLDDSGNPTDIAYQTVKNTAPAYAIPQIAVAHHFGTPNTTFAFGFYPPYAPDLAYDASGAQRYSLIDTLIIQTVLGPSIAHQFTDWLSIGGGVSWNVLIAEQSLNISVPFHSSDVLAALEDDWSPAPNEDPANDVAFLFRATDTGGFGGNLGVLIEPPAARWAVGAMAQFPVAFHATGRMEADFSNHSLYTDGLIDEQVVMAAITTDEEVKIEITMPLILKGGVLFRPSKDTEIELAAVWQNWSSIRQQTITDVDMVIDLNEAFFGGDVLEDAVIDEDVVLPASFTDSLSVRLGGHHMVSDKWTLRAGVLYESSAIPQETQSVGLIDGDKIGYGAGATYQPNTRWALDAGLFQSFLQKRTITDSIARQIAVHPTNGSLLEGTVVGNGVFDSSIFLFGAGLNWFFGTDRKELSE